MKKTIVSILAVFLVSVASAQQLIDKVIAVVGDKAILKSEVDEQLLQAKQQGIPTDENTACFILEELMFQSLLLHQAEIDSIEVTEAQVTAELDQRINYFASQMPGGIADLEKFYGKTIQEIKDEFFIQIENRMKSQQMQQKITENVTISPKEVRNFYNSFPEDSIPDIGSKIAVAQIVIQPEVTDDEKARIKDKLMGIKTKIQNGELSFKLAAEFYSCDPGSKSQGGHFGWVTRGDFVPEFDAVAFKVPIGEISDVFESPYGFHIVKIDERRGEQYIGSHILLCSKVSDEQLIKAKNTLDSIATEIKAERLTWDDAVRKFSTDDQTKGSKGILYNENTGSMYWDMQEIDPQLFKGIDNLKEGEISKPIYFENRDGVAYRLVKLDERTEPHKANLKDDYQMIQNYALAEKKSKVTDEWINGKVRNVYIRIDEDYQNCDFKNNWLLRQ